MDCRCAVWWRRLASRAQGAGRRTLRRRPPHAAAPPSELAPAAALSGGAASCILTGIWSSPSARTHSSCSALSARSRFWGRPQCFAHDVPRRRIDGDGAIEYGGASEASPEPVGGVPVVNPPARAVRKAHAPLSRDVCPVTMHRRPEQVRQRPCWRAQIRLNAPRRTAASLCVWKRRSFHSATATAIARGGASTHVTASDKSERPSGCPIC